LRQVPAKNKQYSYLIVGNGRLSKHFQNYFSLKNISYKVWTRSSEESFQSLGQLAKSVLVLIKDDEIHNFIDNNHKKLSNDKTWIHCSGMLSINLAESAHPLMAFTDGFYNLETYESIPFITEKGRKSFSELFPQLKNPSYQIESSEKTLYHAFCVLSGNFTTMIWQFFFDYLKSKNIPESAAYLYLTTITDNLKNNTAPLTGPIQRNDKNTIQKHLESLNDHPFKNIYISFLEAYEKMIKENMIENDK
jgi:2-dehydropantoate 2-reductase